MKLIIAGSRTITNMNLLRAAINFHPADWRPTEIVLGGARGIDALAERYARENGIRVKAFTAECGLLGRVAGPHRNSKMADYADALLAIWDGPSGDAQDMIEAMEALGKPVSIFYPEKGLE